MKSNDRPLRALFTCYPAHGHLLPMIPLANALRDRGHEVLFATASAFHPTVTAYGFAATPMGADHTSNHAEFVRRTPRFEDVRYELRRGIVFPSLFAEIAAPRAAPDAIELAARWLPDLVVHDLAEFAGPLAAAYVGCPSVTHSWGRVLPLSIATAAAAIVAPLWERYGVEPDEYGGLYRSAYVDICPPALQAPEIAALPTLVASARPELVDADNEEVPDWPRHDAWKTVYVTLGTVFNRAAIFDAVLAGLAEQRVNVLVTVGVNNDPHDFGSVPDHFCIRRYIAQAAVLPHVDAVVCHGGSGTMLGSLAYGLPMLLLPAGADQFSNADACTAAGAGTALTPDQVTAQSVTAAIRSILRNERFGVAARAIQEQVAAMPRSSELVALLEQLAVGVDARIGT